MRTSRRWLGLFAALACGCSALPSTELEAEADRLRDSAMKTFEARDVPTAMALNARAIELARHLPATSWRVVENHDDAGLYFFASGDYAASARHQAVAVLLACGARSNAEPLEVYLERLRWAFSRHRPGFDFTAVAANPLVLLEDRALDVRSNPDLQRRYFARERVNSIARSEPPRYRVRNRRDAPTDCGSARELPGPQPGIRP